MKHVLLLGHPVAHSISPAFQQAAFDHLGIKIHYEACDTPAEELHERIKLLRSSQYLGANVTLPHKLRALDLADEASSEATLAGAANTLVKQNGRLVACNTDIGGFLLALREDAGFDPHGSSALVLGAGGAARAVVVALMQAGAAQITVLNRNAGRANALITSLGSASATRLRAGPLAEAELARIAVYNILVNCTSVGMAGAPASDGSPVPEWALTPGVLVVDVVANPLVTPLLRLAQGRGCPTLGGLAMLVYQGAQAFQLWTGCEAPVSVMVRAAREAMGGS